MQILIKIVKILVSLVIVFIAGLLLIYLFTKNVPPNNLTDTQNNLLYFVAKQYLVENSKQDFRIVTAHKLLADYRNNEVQADTIYRDKELVITGVVDAIDDQFISGYSLGFDTNEFLPSVIASFDEEQKSFLVNLNKGQAVKIECKGNGKTFGIVYLDKCRPFDSEIHLQKKVPSLQKKYRELINEWLHNNLPVKMNSIQSIINNVDSPDFKTFELAVFLLSTPDNNKYLRYEGENIMYLLLPIKDIKLQYKQIEKSIFDKLLAKNFNDITVEQYINLIKEERTKLLRLEK